MSDTVRRALGIAVSARVPVLLWGPPGVGKTSAIRQLAEAAGLPCEIVIASIREPSDFSGLPVVSADGRSVHLVPPAWATRLHEAGRGVLFLDEISTAAPAVQAALLRIVLERVVGELALPPDVTVIAAANPPEEAADGWDLAPPLANRFCHFHWALDVEQWRHGVLAGFPDVRVDVIEADELARSSRVALGEIGAFTAHRPALLHQMPKDERQAGRAWPSPRTWTTAAQLLGAGRLSGAPGDVVHLLVAGAVGPAAAAEFLAWHADLDLPDPEDILRSPFTLVLPERPDRAYAALASVVAAVVNNLTEARWRAAWTALAHASSGRYGDLGVAFARTLIQNRPNGAAPPADALVAMAPLLRASGLFERLT